MLETAFVIAVVVIAAIFAGRDLYRSAVGDEECGCAETCPLARECGIISPRVDDEGRKKERNARCKLLDDETRLWHS